MLLKKKHVLVVLLSSLIIAVVLTSVLIGYLVYIQWKKDSLALEYRDSIYTLTADLFRNDVVLSNVNVKPGGDELFSRAPVLEGSLKNNSGKTISSVQLEIYFQRPNGTVVYKSWFYPLGEQHFGGTRAFFGVRHTRNVLLPGEGISFRHQLRNCPEEVIEQLSRKIEFAKGDTKSKIKMVYSITGMSVL